MAKANNRKLRILSVEDDAGIRQMLEMIYGHAYRFDDAENLAEASIKLKSKPYDVVILDIELPDGRGTDLLRSMREDPEFAACKETPVVMLTGSMDGELYEKSWDLGSIAYVKKPFEVTDLSDAIAQAAANRPDSP